VIHRREAVSIMASKATLRTARVARVGSQKSCLSILASIKRRTAEGAVKNRRSDAAANSSQVSRYTMLAAGTAQGSLARFLVLYQRRIRSNQKASTHNFAGTPRCKKMALSSIVLPEN
jgi:hypothetical protein